MKTESFKLSKDTIALLEKNGIIIATPIQTKIIPAVLAGKDVLAQSETGSGKTISFAIPIIEQIQAADNLVALVLVPTRELCMQVTNEFIKFSQGKRLGVTAVYGGVSIDNQIRKLKKTNIIVATPGRLIDLIDRKTMHLDKIKFLVFDEAYRMLDMGFIHEMKLIECLIWDS
ncbi:MAG: DEAD/DEAH box helicase [Ignavibacteriae bacterium]|nr:DEAD/DEAH box helicase [Ignavibacteriota bacterium]